MPAISRQNTLFVSEDWIRIYEAIQNVEFRAYDFDNFVSAILNHLRDNFPEEFNDWIASSEFVMKVEVLAWLSQNISFRIDLNTRENFLATAERRDSLIRLAQNVAYKINRVTGAKGLVRIDRIRTNEALVDSNNINLQDREIIWNDPKNEDWFEQFITVMNSAFSARTQFGRPLSIFREGAERFEQYVFKSIAPSTGVFNFTKTVNGVSLPFEVINARLDDEDGQIEELPPRQDNAFNVLFRQDGTGLASPTSGFFFPLRQGTLAFQDDNFQEAQIIRIVNIDVPNINNDDFFVQQINGEGEVERTWNKIDTIFGEGVSFNTQSEEQREVYELDTLENDRVRVRFGDGKFGAIPTGRFRFWYRTSTPDPQIIKPNDIRNQTFTIPYNSNGSIFFLTVSVSLKEEIVNSAASESNFSIRSRANQVFYTQNRMITARDYNSFFLRDNAIRKVKTVNRTFSGHSRFTKLNDPTGLYDNLKITADDGRIYQEETLGEKFVTADTTLLTNRQLIVTEINPLLEETDKFLKVLNEYSEIFFNNVLEWNNTSTVAGQSRGNLLDTGGSPVKVSDAGTGNLILIDTDALLRIDSLNGPTTRVSRVIGDGDITDGIILDSLVASGTTVFSVFPAYRDLLNDNERFVIEQQLDLRQTFALTWVQQDQEWRVVTTENININSDFSLQDQGDNTGTNKDSSWLVLVEFMPGEEDQWRIVDRGLGIFFESARDHDFFFASNQFVVNPETGELNRDNIKLLECNEAKDSLRRRNIPSISAVSCPLVREEFEGDGTTTRFQTTSRPLPATAVVTVNDVLNVLNVDYTVIPDIGGDIIEFVEPPSPGSQILVSTGISFINGNIKVETFIGDGTTAEFNLGSQVVTTDNIIVFEDGLLQSLAADFGLGTIGGNASILFNTAPANGVRVVAFMVSDFETKVFDKFSFLGDGSTTSFPFSNDNQEENTVLVAVDGVIQSPTDYNINDAGTTSELEFLSAPSVANSIRLLSVSDPSLTRTQSFSFEGDGATQGFVLQGVSNISPEKLIVSIDGVLQEGPWGTSAWTITGGSTVLFGTIPTSGSKISIFLISAAVGQQASSVTLGGAATVSGASTPNNLGNISVSSCAVRYLGRDVPLFVEDQLFHEDGFVNVNGVQVIPADEDRSGFFDNPFVFKDLVIQDGSTDLVLWRKIQEFGFTIDDPISPLTVPKGTYGRSTRDGPVAGDPIASGVADGDIHYDVSTNTWLIANGVTDVWQAATDQSLFRKSIGRDNLKFEWTHFAPDSIRIDPSVSNIMDAFVLTSTFDDAFRTALFNNTELNNLPEPPTSESLRIQFQEFEDFKAMSDAIIYHPSRYKILFGRQAVKELQATFKIVKNPTVSISDNDLRIRVVAAIDTFFDVENFDFGETFYLTELLAFIHQQLAPAVQTVVAVPNDNSLTFGRLFQVRSEPDELFVSAARAENVEIVAALTDDELRIGTISI